MKYSINFYLEELKPKVYYLTLKNTVYAVLACVVLILGWNLILENQIKETKGQVSRLQQELSNTKLQLSNLETELVQHNDKATFNERKKRLEQNLEAKKMLWEGVGQKLEAATVNYHTVMDELTKLHNENIWLSAFEFNESTIVFRGYALDSSAVTRWMTQLQASDSFRGREFSHLKMKVHDKDSLSFVIATEPQEDVEEAVFGTPSVIPEGLIPPGAIPEGALPPGAIGASTPVPNGGIGSE